jgi:hypothetical protein
MDFLNHKGALRDACLPTQKAMVLLGINQACSISHQSVENENQKSLC